MAKNTDLKAVAQQADMALVAAIGVIKALRSKELLTVEEATILVSDMLAMGGADHRSKTIPVIRSFLPDYEPPRFSVWGPGYAPDFGTAGQMDDH